LTISQHGVIEADRGPTEFPQHRDVGPNERILPLPSVVRLAAGIHQVGEVERPAALLDRLPVADAHLAGVGHIRLARVTVTVQQCAWQVMGGDIHRAHGRLEQSIMPASERGWHNVPGPPHPDLAALTDVKEHARVGDVVGGRVEVGDRGIAPQRRMQPGELADEIGDLLTGEGVGRPREFGALRGSDVLHHDDGAPGNRVDLAPISARRFEGRLVPQARVEASLAVEHLGGAEHQTLPKGLGGLGKHKPGQAGCCTDLVVGDANGDTFRRAAAAARKVHGHHRGTRGVAAQHRGHPFRGNVRPEIGT